jgi:hypothetical protein
MQGNYNYIPEQTIFLGFDKVALNGPGKNYRKLAGVPGVARDDKWRNRRAILCIM